MKTLPVKIHNLPMQVVSYEEDLQTLEYCISEEMASLEFSFPFVDCMGVWNPACGCNRSHNADWDMPFVTMTSKSAPVVSVFSADSRNRCTLALSETTEMVRIYAGIHEEDGRFRIKVEIPLSAYGYSKRNVTVRIDTRNISFSDSLYSVSNWWEISCGIHPMKVPTIAKMPMYSSWYSYHQRIHADVLEEECRLAKKLGFHSIIVDDGWQTGDYNRGYAFCGDWEVCSEKIPNMAKHVASIHDLGMKYLLWFSVPFVGRKSKNWERFKNQLLYYDDELCAGVLDPRYPDVRDYLVATYRTAVVNYDLDGLKLDFVDQFVEKKGTPGYNDKMDYVGVQAAVDKLMSTISRTLKSIRPDIMLEFRQYYIGPNIRQYGNIFRVDDCPNSAIRNRVGIIDLRLLSGCSAVHSDMLMWHGKEAPEDIALQLISCVFATVQVSVLLEKLSERQLHTVAFWIHFMETHRELLQETPIQAFEPHNLYPEVRTEREDEALVALYSQNRVIEYLHKNKFIVLNGTKDNVIYIKVKQTVHLDVISRECTGEILGIQNVIWTPGIYQIPVSTGGLVILECKESGNNLPF